jgi:S1-C subfamily serine protease
MTIAPGLPFRPRQLAFALACGLGLSWLAVHAPPPPRSARAAMPPPLCLRSAPVIQSLGATHYRVSRRAFAQLYRASQTGLPQRGFRVVPAVRDSRPSGVRIYAVAPRSLVAQLGIANGDLIERVNAIPMISPDHILAAYAQVQTASQLRVDLLRGAIHVHLVYELVD